MPTKEDARAWLAHALEDTELAHYGVLGMHWGVRHDVSSSGNGPAAGNTTTARKSSATKTVHVSQHKDTRLSTGEKVALGAYGVAAIAVLGPVAGEAVTTGVGQLGAPLYAEQVQEDLKNIQKHTAGIDRGKDFLNNKVNTDVPVGTVFHRVASYKETEVNAAKYATYLEEDVLRYRNSWITPGRSNLSTHYVTKMTATRDVTIASPDTILKTLERELHTILDDGESLFQKFEKSSSRAGGVNAFVRGNAARTPLEIADDIIFHNRLEIWADDVGKATAQIMQKAGYAAVTDINNTGVQSRKHAVIVLDKSAFNVSSKKLTQFERAAAGIAQKNIPAAIAAVPKPYTGTARAIAVIRAAAGNRVVQRAVKAVITKL